MSSSLTDRWDPLGFDVVLPLRESYRVFGCRFDLVTNETDVLAAARESWPEPASDGDAVLLEVRVIVSEAGEAPARPPRFCAQKHIASVVCDERHTAVCDLDRSFAVLWMSRDAISQRRWFRFHFLEGMVYMALAYRRFTPIHASAVARNGRALLLCGPPGVGKTSLAYVCARTGWSLVTDDVAYLDREVTELAVLGRPRFLRFKGDAVERFPEIVVFDDAIGLDGGVLREVQAEALGLTAIERCETKGVVFLDRQAGIPAAATPVPAADAMRRLWLDLPRFGDTVDAASVGVLERLTAAGAWELTFSDLEDAERVLRQLI